MAFFTFFHRLSSVTMGMGIGHYPMTPNVVIQNSTEEDVMRRSSRGRVEALTDDPAKVQIFILINSQNVSLNSD